MYKDLAHAVEDLKQKGFRNLSKGDELGGEKNLENTPELIRRMKIIKSFRFDQGTDPGDESTLYVLELPDNTKGYMILSYGMYKDPAKSKLIDELRKLEEQ